LCGDAAEAFAEFSHVNATEGFPKRYKRVWEIFIEV